MAATLANQGVNPLSGERVVDAMVVRQVLSVMATCGMYDAAGDWATQVGIPAKSGVAGGMIGALPGQLGIATFSLDFALVSSIDDVARRMLLELARRLTLEGRGVYFVDPELIIPDPDRGDGILVPVLADAEHLLDVR